MNSAYAKEPIPNIHGNQIKLTKEQISFIHDNISSLTAIEIADRLNLRYTHVSSYIKRKNLKRIKKKRKEITFIGSEIKKQETEYFNVDHYFQQAVTI
jgi:hypothetical protein